jgi:hypothetical protein
VTAETPMAITPDGDLKPVTDFTEDEKWWCDDADTLPHLNGIPHVHPGWGLPDLAVDLLTGRDERSWPTATNRNEQET